MEIEKNKIMSIVVFWPYTPTPQAKDDMGADKLTNGVGELGKTISGTLNFINYSRCT